MSHKRTLWFIFLITGFFITSCYTSFRAPRNERMADDENGEAIVPDTQEKIDVYYNPSVPDARSHDFDWFYYYQSAWWRDSRDFMDPNMTARPEPEEYRRRFPQDNSPTDNTYLAPGQAANAGLSKSVDNTTPPATESSKKDTRRDFNFNTFNKDQRKNTPSANQENDNSRNSPADSTTKESNSEKSKPKRR